MERAEFRSAVFARDGHKCVVCGAPGQDAHHIMERRLFPDGGYELDNGVTVCGPCHLKAEATDIHPEELRQLAGIATVVLPEHLYPDAAYDKWGNVLLENGQRLKGELFDDASVRRVLEFHLHEFTDRVKYPRTYHLPWSPGYTSDDRVMVDTSGLDGRECVMTMKMDGEQTTIYADGYVHARSIDSGSHPTRDRVKALAAEVAYELPGNWRICGENLYAKHSIHYRGLDSFFLVFSVWENLRCLPWDETVEWCKLLGLATVPVLWRGKFNANNEDEVHRVFKVNRNYGGEAEHEGYVLRRASDFHMRDFRQAVGKYVRSQHVRTHGHWMREQIVLNGVKE